jgi:dTDP-4-dehydrorhamnose 3,5-epimerase
VLYFISAPYSAEHAAGVRWNDPRIGITWPAQPRVISDRDAAFPDLTP